MTKRNFLLGTSAGKLGDMVFYRAGGEQRTRTRVIPKNPKTIAQMTNRLSMLNLTSIFRSLKPIMESAFPNKKSNQSAYNAFVSANKASKPYYIRKADLEEGYSVPFGIALSKGNMGLTLQPNAITWSPDKDEAPAYHQVLDCLFNMSGLTYTFANPSDATREAIIEGAELYNFVKANAKIALPSEFTLTFVQGVRYDNLALEDKPIWKLAYMVMTFANGTVTSKVYGCDGSDLEPRLRLIADEAPANGTIVVNHVGILRKLTSDDLGEMPMGAILAFKDESGLKVSTSYMLMQLRNIGAEVIRGLAVPYMPGRAYYDIVMEEYGYTAGSVLEANVPIDTSEDEVVEDEGSGEEE